MPIKKKKKVLVAMSGGVDSSVAAALLLQQGYDVTGAFMKQWSETTPEPLLRKEGIVASVCPWKQDRRDALRVAAHLGIPLLTLDFEKEYKEWVMGYMFREYEVGRTPNPDVLCNKWIKFGAWLTQTRKLGFDFLATGHYARVNKQRTTINHQQTTAEMIVDRWSLIVAKDKNKDQTYFLHQLTQEQLQHVLFPIGKYTKPQVRNLARKFKLPTAEREESMGICFVGEIPMKEFLQQKIKPKHGRIVLSSGEIVGEHEGLSFYTIGQRHGFESGIRNYESGVTKPLFVVEKRFETNELVVGHEDDPLLWKKEIEVGDVNWVSGLSPTFPLKCKVRLRHRQEMQNATIGLQTTDYRRQKKVTVDRSPSTVVITFAKPQKAVTSGQFAVFYAKGECLGGGVIV